MPTFEVFQSTSDGRITQRETTKPDLTGDQVLVKISASGVCGTDLHYRTSGIVLGHEGVGTVIAIGPNCSQLQLGVRVGWGYIHDSCGHCQSCLAGREVYCPDVKMYGQDDHDQGSFAHQAVWREAFLFELPEALQDAEAAPLMCAGATIWNAIETYNIRGGQCVGVSGVGGLGHLAIQFAAKLGCEVVAFSSTESKREEALRLGAKHFFVTKGSAKLSVPRELDHLLVTTGALPDWNSMLPLLSAEATIYPLTVSFSNISIPAFPFIAKGLTLQGSVVSPRGAHKRMLKFAAFHGIKPVIETFPMTAEGIEEALHKLDEGKIRYRGVLVAE
ncbi:putative formaldehyde dehydrogenase AdhA [Cyphellophora attinorum]|uniref:Putative formaldehyde dehydrogenase AdhA n=1 Tax=Cyphellophora attinorum TaxID=1664694 RepID=A0A0N0NMB6_9EURO|nr:putative formaldehyde dehydrogenase AdhA [Phialophora attinorum]KPI40019.1 putative formaldehyde dehydrogenase AdhA [Phialophora attinorum]